MHRCCSSRSDDLGMLGDFREFFGSDERRLIRKLQAAEQELRSEREAAQLAVENSELYRDEVRDYEASYRNAQQKLYDAERMDQHERWEFCEEVASQAASELRTAEHNLNLEARREAAEARCKAFTEGARKGEEVMLERYEDALLRAMQCGREEGSAEIHAVSEISQSLRDELHVAEAAQQKTAQELAVEEHASSLHRSETAHEIAELREELQCARQDHRVQLKAVVTKSDHVRDVDVSRHECEHANGSTRSAELTTAATTDCRFAEEYCRSADESNSSACSMHEERDPEVDRVSAGDSRGAVTGVAADIEEASA